jgi:hypothetical protein
MTTTDKSNKTTNQQKPTTWILCIAAGVMMQITSYIKYVSLGERYSFETVDMVKIAVGLVAIGLGCYKLLQKKSV